MSEEISGIVDRRTFLGGLASVGGAAIAGCSAIKPENDGKTSPLDAERAQELATKFAPTLYFDVNEPWFPTDPRPYSSERNGETVVNGFDALNGYHERYSGGVPPDPTVFYHGVKYDDASLAVVQFWFYTVFDQFTTNFHWHDWEVLHVFVDTDTGDPQLFVASSHSRKVPNNEFLDPDPAVIPRVLSELGSHSSALSVNDVPEHFQRIAITDLLADITNTAIEGVESLTDGALPVAYGLPRDEGFRLPYLIPEYEGAPLYEHERLPAVTRESLIGGELTVRSYDALASPPTDLPGRESGRVFQHAERAGGPDIEYDLVSTEKLEHIADFTGPQLSFEFSVPDVVEDAVGAHIATTGTPVEQPRYDNPVADITTRKHLAALADRYDTVGEPASITTVATQITEAITSEDAPENEGLTTTETGVESVVMLESDPEAVPTFNGVAIVQDVPAGKHQLTVNGVGRAPHSESVIVADEETTQGAGVAGEIPLVAHENATKLEVSDANAAIDLSAVTVEDDFAGRLYNSPVENHDAVYIHTGGAYAIEVRDSDDAAGAYRVNPASEDESGVRIERPETGKAPLSEFVASIAEETRLEIATYREGRDVSSPKAVEGLERALGAVVEAAQRSAERARAKERVRADRKLDVVVERLNQVESRLTEVTQNLPNPISRAAESRLEQANRRAEQARTSEKLGPAN